MVICTIMRMLDGICLRMLDTKKLENAVTNVSAIHMVTVVFRLLVTASAEQIPIICRAIGLLSKIGPNSSSLVLVGSAIAHLLVFDELRVRLFSRLLASVCLCLQSAQVRAETVLAHPEAHQIVHTIGGQGSTRQTVNLV